MLCNWKRYACFVLNKKSLCSIQYFENRRLVHLLTYAPRCYELCAHQTNIKYMIKCASDWRQGGCFLRFPPPIKLPPRYNWNIVESLTPTLYYLNKINTTHGAWLLSFREPDVIPRFSLCIFGFFDYFINLCYAFTFYSSLLSIYLILNN